MMMDDEEVTSQRKRKADGEAPPADCAVKAKKQKIEIEDDDVVVL